MTDSLSPKKEKAGPTKTITLGRNPKTAVTINIYPASKGRFVAILYDTAGERVRIERGSLAAAEEDARDHVGKHISPEAIEKNLVESQAARLVAPTDLLVACAEYAEATKLLQPVKASLLEAVRYFTARKHEDSSSVTAAFAVEDYLAGRRGRKKTQKANSTYLGRLKKDWGEKLLTEVDHVYVNRWIDSIELSERSKRNHYDAASLIFRHAKTRGWFPTDRQSPTQAATRPDAENAKVETYTPMEGAALLQAAKDLDSPAYPVVALVGWSGSRTEEIAPEFADKGRLRWENIIWADLDGIDDEEDAKPQENQIYVDEDAAKRTKRKSLWRYMPLIANLATMLTPFRDLKGPIYPESLHNITKEFDVIAKKAGVEWKRNALRHSYGTYRYAILREVGRLADEMGNSPQMVRAYYTKPMPTHLGKQWFKVVVEA